MDWSLCFLCHYTLLQNHSSKNKAGYMAIHLRTVGQEQWCKNRSQFRNVTNTPTNHRTDGPSDTARRRVTCPQLKKNDLCIVEYYATWFTDWSLCFLCHYTLLQNHSSKKKKMIYAMLNSMPFDSRVDPFVSFVTTLCSEIIQVKKRKWFMQCWILCHLIHKLIPLFPLLLGE